MPAFMISRLEVRADARVQAEQAMHELATYVRKELPGVIWSAFRSTSHYIATMRAETPAALEQYRNAAGTRAFQAALAPLLVGSIDEQPYELVTSSDLAPRRRGR
jgi:quinol monooxygenase YgiN